MSEPNVKPKRVVSRETVASLDDKLADLVGRLERFEARVTALEELVKSAEDPFRAPA